MLDAVAGTLQGIANKVYPRLYLYDQQNGKQYILDILDKIYFDYLTSNAISDDIARLAVLLLPFGYQAGGPDILWAQEFSDALRKLVGIGILPVVSAGNDGVVSAYKLRSLSTICKEIHLPIALGVE